jgi:transaldolase/glucose-6-phosphate isomerase
MNPLKELGKYGQSVWLDYIRRGLITSGELMHMVEEDGLGGVTSNPAIFQKAITGSADYAESMKSLKKKEDLGPMGLYEKLAIADIRDAADVLAPVYESTEGRDGYVSLEVSPYLARETEATIEEAKRLWQSVNRKNLMIKVPATGEGIPAIERLIGEGINVNVTLIFSISTYESVAEAYISGLETFASRGGDVSSIGSVASFFISRIDSAVDTIFSARLKTAKSIEESDLLKGIAGTVAIASARIAYRRYKEIFHGKRWESLTGKGARTQRLLWASTGTKNPAYRDVLYVEELIGPDTVNTMPPSTYDAFRDHGRLRASLEEDTKGAEKTMENLNKIGISLEEVTKGLQRDGVRLFAEAFDALLSSVDNKCRGIGDVRVNSLSYTIPADLKSRVDAELENWKVGGKVRRLWSRDASIWTAAGEGDWLGWLTITEDQRSHGHHLLDISEEVKEEGYSHALLLGMGGSSLCPEVLKMTFGETRGFPRLHVLDSTDPAQVSAFEKKIDPAGTLFIVSSKSGTTLEPGILKRYFFQKVKEKVGADSAGDRFIAITDPGSQLQEEAEEEGFRHVFHGDPSIGGRYSALSNFGMVPGAIMGVDVLKFLDRADEMALACSSCISPEKNSGVLLGILLGVLGKAGRNKVTFITSPGIRGLGAWLEQLLAESTGKQGKALIPVDREPPGPPGVYGMDRLFVYVRLEPSPDPAQDAAIDALKKAGHPVVLISFADSYALGQEFFRWEMATAVAGSVMGINPFDQPDVEAAKVATRKLTDEYEEKGTLPPEESFFEDDGIRLFAGESYAGGLEKTAGEDRTLAGYLRAHVSCIEPGDYFALLAYVEMNHIHEERLQEIRLAVRDSKHVATCLGFGPRFLHSTGQAYKGGPNSGVFLQITCDDSMDLPVPGRRYTFGAVKNAQARGDFQVLTERNRRALRVHVGKDVSGGLKELEKAIKKALL